MQFVQPSSLAEALAALVRHGYDAKIIAGGTALTLMLQQRLIAPEVLISLDGIPGLDFVRLAGDGLHIGPSAKLSDLARSAVVLDQAPALARACGSVGNVRVRNQATLGGNLAEADYASDPPTALLALDALVSVTGPSGSRTVPLSDFFLGMYTTVLEPDEILTEVFVPRVPANSRMIYLRYMSRSSEDRPCVGVAAVASFDGPLCADLRVAVGAACEVPRRLPEVEARALGRSLGDGLIEEIAREYAAGIDTLEDLRGSAWYRTQMIRVHVRRALMELQNGRG